MPHVLYDRIKGSPVHDVGDGLTPEDVKAFCDAHDVEFHAMGTPPVAGGTGWDDPTVFRVATRPGMMDGSPRGLTVSLDKVRDWLSAQADMSAGP